MLLCFYIKAQVTKEVGGLLSQRSVRVLLDSDTNFFTLSFNVANFEDLATRIAISFLMVRRCRWGRACNPNSIHAFGFCCLHLVFVD